MGGSRKGQSWIPVRLRHIADQVFEVRYANRGQDRLLIVIGIGNERGESLQRGSLLSNTVTYASSAVS